MPPDECTERIVLLGLKILRTEYLKEGIDYQPVPGKLHKWRGDFLLYQYEPIANRLLWHKGNPHPFTSAVQVGIIDQATTNLLLKCLRETLNRLSSDDLRRLFADDSFGEILHSTSSITEDEFRDIRKGKPSPLDNLCRSLDLMSVDSDKTVDDWQQSVSVVFQSLGSVDNAEKPADPRWRASAAVELACLGPWYGIAPDDLLKLLEYENLVGKTTRGEIFSMVAACAPRGKRCEARLYANGFQGLLVGFAGRAAGFGSKRVRDPVFDNIAHAVDRVAAALGATWAQQRLLASVEELRKAGDLTSPQESARGINNAIRRLCSPVNGLEVGVGGAVETSGNVPTGSDTYYASKKVGRHTANVAIRPAPNDNDRSREVATCCLENQIYTLFALAKISDTARPYFEETRLKIFLETTPQGTRDELLKNVFVHVVAKHALDAFQLGKTSFMLSNSRLPNNLKEAAKAINVEDRMPKIKKTIRLRNLLLEDQKVVEEIGNLGILWDRSASNPRYIGEAWFNFLTPSDARMSNAETP